MTRKNIDFSSLFQKANFISLIFITVSLIAIIFKGLNYGIDFKGGTLIELRSETKDVSTFELRSSLNLMNLGDVNVKEFGQKGDFLIKVEEKFVNKNDITTKIKENLERRSD